MYLVQWNDQEGNLQTRRFERLEDAHMEAEYLSRYYDGVEIIDEETGEPVEL